MMCKSTTGWLVAAIALVLVLTGVPALRAQECDDSDPCTMNDQCGVDGSCHGTFQVGKSCNDFNDCTVNDACKTDPLIGNVCMGDPGSVGAPCADGCGTCQQTVPFPGAPLLCTGEAADNGKDCDPKLGVACIVGTCQINAGNFHFALCSPSPKQCPDTDNNPCTDNCNFATGECQQDAPKCDGVCSTCNPTTGQCETTHLGMACEDSNPCTTQSACQTIAGIPFAVCLGGVPSSNPTATATVPGVTPTAVAPTATATSGVAPTPAACIGDCNDNKIVAVNELITGVNIALGRAPISQCSSFDTNGNQMVDINELIGAVRSALNGCV